MVSEDERGKKTPASREGLCLKQKENVLLLFRLDGEIRMQLCRGGWVRLSQPPGLPCGTLFRWCALGSEVSWEGCVCYFQSETGSPYLFCALCFRAGRKPKRSLEDCRKNCLLFVFDFPKLCQSLAYTRNPVIVKLLITELPKPSLECL